MSTTAARNGLQGGARPHPLVGEGKELSGSPHCCVKWQSQRSKIIQKNNFQRPKEIGNLEWIGEGKGAEALRRPFGIAVPSLPPSLWLEASCCSGGRGGEGGGGRREEGGGRRAEGGGRGVKGVSP